MSSETDRQDPPAPRELPPPASAERTSGIRRSRWLYSRMGVIVLLITIGLLRWHSTGGVTKATPPPSPDAHLTVAVVPAERRDLFNEVAYPAEFRPYAEVELHAKVSGYVKKMYVDFHDRVKRGQLLAILDVPELTDQFHNAVAVQQKAEADYRAAQLYYSRLAQTAKENPGGVAGQDVDAASAREGTANAAIAAAKADVERYQTLIGYATIAAPFDGVITKRYVDEGTLIQAGTTSDTQSLPLVRVSDNYHLRLDFPVEVKYVSEVHVGDPVEVRVESLNGKALSGTITRTTDRVTEDTRTMLTEIEVANPDLELIPGMYATAIFRFQRRPNVLSVPITTVAGETNKTVYLVNDQNQIEERSVKVGLETADRYEVLAGLREGDRVMIGTRYVVQPGETVNPVVKPAPGEEPTAH